MNTSVTRNVCSPRNTASHVTLALACAALAAACSGEYPLGSASSSLDLAADDPSTGGEVVGSVAVPEGLGSRAGFIARGPAGARWAAAIEGP